MDIKELIIQESFHQNFLIEAEKFVEFCKDRELNIDEEVLEFLEKAGIIVPVMKVKNKIVFDSTTELKELYIQDQVILSQEFISWKKFYEEKDGYREQIIYPYYHPYQIYHIEKILSFKSKYLTKWTDISEKDLERFKQASKDEEKFLELLFLIQNKYLPSIRQYAFVYMAPGDDLDKLKNLQENIIPKKIIEILNVKIEDIIKYREKIGCHGLTIDPLEKWYDIVRCIREDKRKELKGKALLAQDYYLVFDILSLLLKDLGKKHVNVESWCNSINAFKKLTHYGKDKELDYCSRNVLERTLHEYGISPRPILALIVEGDTEEEVFNVIANAENMSLGRFGIKIVNTRGVDKDIRELVIDYIRPYIGNIYNKHYILGQTKVFILRDREGTEKWAKRFVSNPPKEIDGIIKEILEIIRKENIILSENQKDIYRKEIIGHHIWNKNFEYDNFTDDRELLIELKKYGNMHNKQLKNITLRDIELCRKENKDLNNFIKEKTGNSVYLGKREFGEQLGRSIVREIKYRKNKSDNQRPIEKILYNILEFAIKRN